VINWTVNNSGNSGWCDELWSPGSTAANSVRVYPSSTPGTYYYTLKCYGYGMSPVTGTASVTVLPLPSITITVVPNIPAWHPVSGPCPYGTNNYTRCSASWVATNATSCTLYNSSSIAIAWGTNNPNGTNSGGQSGGYPYMGAQQQGVAGWNWDSYIHLTVSCTGDGGSASKSWYWSYGSVWTSSP
jgi:hypothetical protein